jgi:anhydro-N-acetylmuramic acid kinase
MPEKYRVTGVMSGSSLDGVDMAYCEFSRDKDQWDFRIIHSETIPYSALLKEQLENCAGLDLDEIIELDGALGEYFAEIINDFHCKYHVTPDLIASHGHTLFHEPEKGITFQAGHGGIMADRTGIMVINDFRKEDVEQGGQGAPLVPIGDLLLFGKYDACVNLGGFSNISYDNNQKKRLAFDVGPANLALNRIASKAGKDMDENGEIGARGIVDPDYLKHLNSLEYYSRIPPKSLGKEWFLKEFIPYAEEQDLSIEDQMATMVEHIAIQQASAVALACVNNVLLSGGGAMNPFLVSRFRFHTGARIHIPSPEIIQFKEALVFAFLGLLRYLGEVNCLASVTGGKSNLCAGTIHQLIKKRKS